MLAAGRDIISFAPGYPAPDTFPWNEFRQIAADLLGSREQGVLQYGPTRGYRPLLDTITAIMAHRGIATKLEDLLVTTGSQQGLDLVGRVLIDPGDVILVELPTYVGAISAFRNLRADLVGVPQEADGIDLAALDATCERLRREGRRVKLLYVVPNFQNPTGLLIGLEKRQRLLEWAERRDVLIVEDDPYCELYFEDSAGEADVRPIKADDRNGRVIYLSSFSKTLAPGFRVAWLAAPPALAAKFEMAKQAGDLLTGSLDQRLIYEACRRGVLERQLPVLRAHYAHKRDVMEQALRRELGTSVSWPKPTRRLLPVAHARERARRRQDDPAGDRAGRDLRRRGSVLCQRPGAQHAAALVLGPDAGTDRRGRRPARGYSTRRIGSTGDRGRSRTPGSVVSGWSGGSCSATGQPMCDIGWSGGSPRSSSPRTVPSGPSSGSVRNGTPGSTGPRRQRDDCRLVGRREEGQLPVVGQTAGHREHLQPGGRLADIGRKVALHFSGEWNVATRVPVIVVQDDQARLHRGHEHHVAEHDDAGEAAVD